MHMTSEEQKILDRINAYAENALCKLRNSASFEQLFNQQNKVVKGNPYKRDDHCGKENVHEEHDVKRFHSPERIGGKERAVLQTH